MRIATTLFAVLILASIASTGCGNSANDSDLQSTGLKTTPPMSQAQVQAAWEVKHPGQKAPM